MGGMRTGPCWLASATAAALTAAMAQPAAAEERQMRFEIPAQSVPAALQAFAKASGRPVVFEPSDVNGKVSRPVTGVFTPDQALRVLLTGTDVRLRSTPSGVFVVGGAGVTKTAWAQAPQATGPSGSIDQAAPTSSTEVGTTVEEVVVTGLRESLARAAEIKRSSPQVVDALVADDIGKFPDNTTAAALQRVPGVQVFTGDNNEIVNPLVRGLSDILTTLDGREIFSGVSRGFAFQDLPAEALAGVQVYKSNSADFIEGGVAGVINLQLHKPFDFKNRTIAANARAIYGENVDKTGYTLGLLLSDRWTTSAGEFGALVDVSYAKQYFDRPITFNCDFRSGNQGPPGAGGVTLPTCVGGLNHYGEYERPQVNGSLVWRPNDDLELYADGLYTGYKSPWETDFIFSDVFGAQSVSNVRPGADCETYLVNPAGFYSPTGVEQRLCNGLGAQFADVPGLTSTQVRDAKTDQYLVGGGFKFDDGRASLSGDLSFQESETRNSLFIVDIGKIIPVTTLDVNVGGGARVDMPGDPLGQAEDFRFANSLFQQVDDARGALLAGQLDGGLKFDGLFREITAGLRYADRETEFSGFAGGPPAPGGNRNTLIGSVGLPAGFLQPSPSSLPWINNGQRWLTPDRDFLSDNKDLIRGIYGAPPGELPFDPSRSYRAGEKTYAAYVQGAYEHAFGADLLLDGLVGLRVTKTDRQIEGTGRVSGVLTPVDTDSSDTDWLPNASARLRVGPDLQFRTTYAKVLSRPAFGDLNPGLFYDVPLNANIVPAGSGGNPDLKPQESDSFDVTAEYYFTRNSYVAGGVYYRKIKNRVISIAAEEVIGGITYIITRPQNTAEAELTGLELSGQTFFDFLPAPLDGFGVFGNYTLADSEVTGGPSELIGTELTNVSKHNYNLGLLYEKHGITGRVVYTHRSDYNEFLIGPGSSVRPSSLADPDQVIFNGVQDSGRLDFSLAYDLASNVTVSFDGVNVNGAKYKSYFGTPRDPHDIRLDETSYGVSLRVRY